MRWMLLCVFLCSGCCAPGRVIRMTYYPSPSVRVDMAITINEHEMRR